MSFTVWPDDARALRVMSSDSSVRSPSIWAISARAASSWAERRGASRPVPSPQLDHALAFLGSGPLEASLDAVEQLPGFAEGALGFVVATLRDRFRHVGRYSVRYCPSCHLRGVRGLATGPSVAATHHRRE